ncbi:unnamed protein product, partial [Meganyctiphanes norvegica]
DFSERLDVATAVIKEFGGNFSMVDDYLDHFSFESKYMTQKMMHELEQLGARIWSSPSLDGKFQFIQSFLEQERLVPRAQKKIHTTASSLCYLKSGGILQSYADFNWCKTIFGGIIAVSTLLMNPFKEKSRSARSTGHAFQFNHPDSYGSSYSNAPSYSVSSSHFDVPSYSNGPSNHLDPTYSNPPPSFYSTSPSPIYYTTAQPPPPKCTDQAACDRTLVPYCNANGYLELLDRFKVLNKGDTGLPWNPIAANISIAATFCQ